jgi:transcription elongation factor GreA
MMQKQVTLTEQGYKQISEELDFLKGTRRAEVAEKIKVARGFGDLSENAEYDEAKNEQAQLEARINELENTLKVAVVLSKDQIKHNTVSLGTTVRVHIVEPDFEEDAEFDIVGSNEANPMEGRISDESPVGKALVGHMVGETVELETTYGLTTYEILAVSPTA